MRLYKLPAGIRKDEADLLVDMVRSRFNLGEREVLEAKWLIGASPNIIGSDTLAGRADIIAFIDGAMTWRALAAEVVPAVAKLADTVVADQTDKVKPVAFEVPPAALTKKGGKRNVGKGKRKSAD